MERRVDCFAYRIRQNLCLLAAHRHLIDIVDLLCELGFFVWQIERLKNEEEAEDVTAPLREKRPRAIVLGPARELTDQVRCDAR